MTVQYNLNFFQEELAAAVVGPSVKVQNLQGDHAVDSGTYASETMLEVASDIGCEDTKRKWIEGLVIESTEQGTEIQDVEDDIEREMGFYNQARLAAFQAVSRFESEAVIWRRPSDYMAEMVKSDGHMAKVKEQLLHEQQVIEEAEQRRKDRESKKYSKQVAAERRMQRGKERKKAIEAVSSLKTGKVQSNLLGDTGRPAISPNDSFSTRSQATHLTHAKNKKRQERDAKYGFGGRKRRQKQNDAFSAAGGGSFKSQESSGHKMQRLGKSKRQKMRAHA
jgi:rRNA-processing protein EBP2